MLLSIIAAIKKVLRYIQDCCPLVHADARKVCVWRMHPGPCALQCRRQCRPSSRNRCGFPQSQAQHIDNMYVWLAQLHVMANRHKAPRLPAAGEDDVGPGPQEIRSFRLSLRRVVRKQLRNHLRARPAQPIGSKLAVRMKHLLLFTLCCGDVMPAVRLVSVASLSALGEARCQHESCGHRSCPGNTLGELRGGESSPRAWEARLTHFKVGPCRLHAATVSL